MMAASLTVVLVALLSLVHGRRWGAWGWLAAAGLGLGALAAAVVTPDVPAWAAWALVAAAGVWLWLSLWRGADVAAIWLVAAVAALVLTAGEGAWAPGHRVTALLAVVGVALFLTHAANDICRAVLDRARVPHAGARGTSAEAGSEAATSGPTAETDPSTLRGGRFIGPLERWAVAALALVGAQGVIVGLMAAKGIGRYPELAGDKGHGTKVEEFLIGSLVSWLIAGAAALFLHRALR